MGYARPVELDPDSLERLVPDRIDPADVAAKESLAFHLERYEFAAQQLRPGRLLDLACGVGYGTRLLATRSPVVTRAVGVDVSPEAVRHASERYADRRIEFTVGDALEFTDVEGFDSIVSLETIEHLEQPRAFLARLASMLRPRGVLIASVPTTPSTDLNPHHRHDFSEASFRRLGAEQGLEEVACLRQTQRAQILGFLGQGRFRAGNLRRNLPGYYLSHPRALAKRIASTLRYGLANHYLTLVWRRSQ